MMVSLWTKKSQGLPRKCATVSPGGRSYRTKFFPRSSYSGSTAMREEDLGKLLDVIIDHRGKTPKKLGGVDFKDSGVPVVSAYHQPGSYRGAAVLCGSYAPLQTSIELPGRCGDSWRYHRHRPGPQLPEMTREPAKEWGLLLGHGGFTRSSQHSRFERLRRPCRFRRTVFGLVIS